MRIDDQGHGTSLYHYDLLDRLRTVEGPTPEAFLFDPASNLLEALDGQEASDAQASQALPEPDSPNAHRPQQTPGNRLKRQGNRRFTYDERGNRTEEIVERGARLGQVTRYRYNAQNQLVDVNVGGVKTRYAYDALGRRISKTSENGNTHFYWNGDVLLGEVSEGANNTKPSRTYLFEPFSFKPLALVQHGEVFHYHTDHIGTPREITNTNMDVVWSASFKTYGALAVANVTEVDNPLRFQGQYFDCETGLHYNRHRYYDPNCGQFTTQDPIGLLGGMNAYQYAPNPVTWVDPWGLSSKDCNKRPDFYVGSDGTAIPGTFHRYANSKYAPISDAKSGTLPPKKGGMYVSFDEMDDAVIASDKLQIPYRPDYRVSGDTIDILDKMEIPNGDWGRSLDLEPITKDFKKFGPGKATQVIIYGDIPIDPSSIKILP